MYRNTFEDCVSTLPSENDRLASICISTNSVSLVFFQQHQREKKTSSSILFEVTSLITGYFVLLKNLSDFITHLEINDRKLGFHQSSLSTQNSCLPPLLSSMEILNISWTTFADSKSGLIKTFIQKSYFKGNCNFLSLPHAPPLNFIFYIFP